MMNFQAYQTEILQNNKLHVLIASHMQQIKRSV